MHLVQVPPDAVINGESPLKAMWPLIEPLLQKAIAHSDGIETIEGTVRDLMAKNRQLWVVIGEDKSITAVGVTKLQKYDSGIKEAAITLLAGDDGKLNDLLDLRSELESWAKIEGCNRFRVYGRKGWAKRMPDYKLASYVLSKDL